MATQILQASKLTLWEVETKFHLQQIDTSIDWTKLPDLLHITDHEKQRLDEVKQHYRYLSKQSMLEVMVKMVVLSPLLALAGFYDPPFFTKAEAPIEIALTEEGELIRGQIDLLTFHDQIWVATIESKQVQFDVMAALPQLLTYMMTSSQTVTYGLLCNGSRFVFVRLLLENLPQYELSSTYSLTDPGNALYEVLQILKRLAELTVSSANNGVPTKLDNKKP